MNESPLIITLDWSSRCNETFSNTWYRSIVKIPNLERSVDTWEERPDERVTETVGRRWEFVENAGVAISVVSFVVSFSQQIEAVQVDGVPAENARQVFVVDDMLPDGAQNFTARHVKSFVVPLSVDTLQLAGDPVVFAHHDRVQDTQSGIFRSAWIASIETKSRSRLAFGQSTGLRQQITAAERRDGHVHPSAGESAKPLRFARRLSVDVTQVEVGWIHVDLFAGTEPLLAGQRSGKRHANRPASLKVDFGKERIVARYGNRPAFRMDVGRRVAIAAIQNGVLIHQKKTPKRMANQTAHNKLREQSIRTWKPREIGVRVTSWSRNWPNMVVIMV